MINIRQCRRGDVPKVIEIEKKSFEHPYKKDIFIYFLNKDVFLVAEKGEKIVGYIMADDREGETLIISIAVHPEHRLKGIGKRLMNEAVSRFDNDIVTLTLRTKNKTAFKFYERLGFRVKGLIREYYENNDDALIMKKKVKQDSQE